MNAFELDCHVVSPVVIGKPMIRDETHNNDAFCEYAAEAQNYSPT
jgi:hypothetical protein